MSNEGWKRNLAVPFVTQRDNIYATVSIEKWENTLSKQKKTIY